METYFIFLVKASCCLVAFYMIGYMLFSNDKAFKLQRFYLLAAVLLSLTLPFNRTSISVFKEPESTVLQTAQTSEAKIVSQPFVENKAVKEAPQSIQATPVANKYSLLDVITFLYWAVMVLFLARVLYSFVCIAIYYFRGQHIKDGKYTIIFLSSGKSSFSFFRWIFISADIEDIPGSQTIIKHEIVHANQYHSLDVIVVELLSAVMWFNPFIWLLRKDVQQLHEYLADEGVVLSGTNVLEYQALLVNQVAGDRLISLPSGFSQSLIKKRLAMMTKTSMNQHKWYRLLALIPITGIMFMILSFTNKEEIMSPVNHPSKSDVKSSIISKSEFSINVKKDTTKKIETPPPPPPSKKATTPPPPPLPKSGMVAAVAPTKMNVFYLGVDNPVSIAVSGVPQDKIYPTISNGTIRREGTLYIVNPRQVGLATINILAEVDGKKINAGTMDFRVKRVPDPVAKVGGKKGGSIDVNTLLAQMIVQSDLENFDFDMRFTITKFIVVADIKGAKEAVTSKTNKITDEQKTLIRKLSAGDNVYFQDIKAVGPDGIERELPAIAFTIKE
jgi:beta-lactamase regulating signal transducer with metallopeptidase domain